MTIAKNTICLWFDSGAEEAARFYAATFPDSHVDAVQHAPTDFPGGKAGQVLTVQFTVAGIPCLGLNGGPVFKFSPAVSLMVNCDTQAEIDHYWARLGEGGDPAAQQCGWLADRYGVSWQITPRLWEQFHNSANAAGAQRAMKALMGMKKLDIAQLQAAFDGAA